MASFLWCPMGCLTAMLSSRKWDIQMLQAQMEAGFPEHLQPPYCTFSSPRNPEELPYYASSSPALEPASGAPLPHIPVQPTTQKPHEHNYLNHKEGQAQGYPTRNSPSVLHAALIGSRSSAQTECWTCKYQARERQAMALPWAPQFTQQPLGRKLGGRHH